MAKDCNRGPPNTPNPLFFGGQVGAKLRSKSTSKLLEFSTSFRIEFQSLLGSILEPCWPPKSSPKPILRKIERFKNIKNDYRVGGGSIFKGQGVSKIDEKSKPKRLQDKNGFQEAKNNEKVSNIGPSWRPKSSQVASKSKLQMKSILSGPKTRPRLTPMKKLPRVLTSQGLRPKAT